MAVWVAVSARVVRLRSKVRRLRVVLGMAAGYSIMGFVRGAKRILALGFAMLHTSLSGEEIFGGEG